MNKTDFNFLQNAKNQKQIILKYREKNKMKLDINNCLHFNIFSFIFK